MTRLAIPAAAALAVHGLIFALGGGWFKSTASEQRPDEPLAITLRIMRPDPAAPAGGTSLASPAPEPRILPTPPQPASSPSPETLPSPPKPSTAPPVPPCPPDLTPSGAPVPPADQTAVAAAPVEPPPVAPRPELIALPDLGTPGQQETTQAQAPATASKRVYQESEALAGSGIQKAVPKYKENPPPRYPSLARRRGYEGMVVLNVLVTPDGRVGDLMVQRSSGHTALDESALEAVEDWRFVPAREGSDAVAMWVRVPVLFKLSN